MESDNACSWQRRDREREREIERRAQRWVYVQRSKIERCSGKAHWNELYDKISPLGLKVEVEECPLLTVTRKTYTTKRGPARRHALEATSLEMEGRKTRR